MSVAALLAASSSGRADCWNNCYWQYVSDQNVPPAAAQLITANGQHSLRIAYDRDIPFLYNVDFLVHFDHTVDLATAERDTGGAP